MFENMSSLNIFFTENMFDRSRWRYKMPDNHFWIPARGYEGDKAGIIAANKAAPVSPLKEVQPSPGLIRRSDSPERPPVQVPAVEAHLRAVLEACHGGDERRVRGIDNATIERILDECVGKVSPPVGRFRAAGKVAAAFTSSGKVRPQSQLKAPSCELSLEVKAPSCEVSLEVKAPSCEVSLEVECEVSLKVKGPSCELDVHV